MAWRRSLTAGRGCSLVRAMDIPLGKATDYSDVYDPSLLAPMDRRPARERLGLSAELPFAGEDVWNAYEFSWLIATGLPQVALLQLRVDAASPRMIESKSMKLYLNGFAQTRFESADRVLAALRRDLAEGFGAPVAVDLFPPADADPPHAALPGTSLDALDIDTDVYEPAPELLVSDPAAQPVAETLHTDLFRSLCPVTGQPDWASLLIRYAGAPIDHAGLLRYLVSFRRHQAFHEATIEQIFVDLKTHCGCRRLVVGGYFLRRGGIDINPFRADPGEVWPVLRLVRQ